MLKINVTKKKMKIRKIALVMAIVTVLGVFGGWTWKMPNFLLKFKPVKTDLIEKKLPEKRNVNIDRNNKISGEALQKFTETTFAEVLKEKKNMVYSPINLKPPARQSDRSKIGNLNFACAFTSQPNLSI